MTAARRALAGQVSQPVLSLQPGADALALIALGIEVDHDMRRLDHHAKIGSRGSTKVLLDKAHIAVFLTQLLPAPQPRLLAALLLGALIRPMQWMHHPAQPLAIIPCRRQQVRKPLTRNNQRLVNFFVNLRALVNRFVNLQLIQ